MPPTLWSVGHGTRSIEELVGILQAAGIECLVDVRTAPGSRKHPQFGKDELAASLAAAGIEYVWRKDLGGFRKPNPPGESPHTALTSPGFRGYADHMDTEDFDLALRWLIASARKRRTAFMCAESLWWRCHRRLLADALAARGCTVLHLMGRGSPVPHRLHPAARIEGHRVVYDLDQPEQATLTQARLARAGRR